MSSLPNTQSVYSEKTNSSCETPSATRQRSTSISPENVAGSGQLQYEFIIQTALDCSLVNTAILSEKMDEDGSIKDALDVIINGVSKSWAPFKATMASLVAKIKYPDWDTRYHQTQIGGKFSLRGIDRNYVSDFLYKNGMYDTPTEFALTRSFEKPEPFNKTYSGKISPKECKAAFLNVVEIVNTASTLDLCHAALAYLSAFLKTRKDQTTTLRNTVVAKSSKLLEILDVLSALEEINKLGSGSSVIPVIITHTLLSTIQPYLWPGISIQPLKEHTTADMRCASYGDVEGMDAQSTPKIAIEIKHKIPINESIVMVFDSKTNKDDIPLKFIITTAKTTRWIAKNNICVDSLSNFVASHLQQALFHENRICVMFVEELRMRMVDYRNIGVQIKSSVNEILTPLLV